MLEPRSQEATGEQGQDHGKPGHALRDPEEGEDEIHVQLLPRETFQKSMAGENDEFRSSRIVFTESQVLKSSRIVQWVSNRLPYPTYRSPDRAPRQEVLPGTASPGRTSDETKRSRLGKDPKREPHKTMIM